MKFTSLFFVFVTLITVKLFAAPITVTGRILDEANKAPIN
jgi:hypothetical protein